MEAISRFFSRPIRIAANAIARRKKGCDPAYDPNAWNDANGIQYNNNCYNYACNIETGTRAQPGLASGQVFGSLADCSEVDNGAQSDGLAPIDQADDCSGCSDDTCCHKVALAIWPGVDFHWYRLDDNGNWSHKPGQTEATNVDYSFNTIADPQNADRGPYTEFCGYYCVCDGIVSIK